MEKDVRSIMMVDVAAEVVVAGLALVVPVLLGSQLVVGSIINAVLFYSSVHVSKKSWWMVVVLPSVGVAARGLIFGAMSLAVVPFWPMIWVGNLLLMVVYSRVKGVLGVGLAALLKMGWLMGMAYMFVGMGWVPEGIKMAMGTMQGVTAVIGGLIALGFMNYAHRDGRNE